MYNVRVSAEFSPTNIHDPLHASGTTRREGDLSEIHVADIYRRKASFAFFSSFIKNVCVTKIFYFMSCLFFPSINESIRIVVILSR